MKKYIKPLLITLPLLYPALSFADYLGGTTQLVIAGARIISALIVISFALAMLFFFWGLAKYIRSAGTDKEEGRMMMVWGVVALFVMSSVWGLVRFIQTEFSITNNDTITVPTIQGQG